jgi:hypothetical protein
VKVRVPNDDLVRITLKHAGLTVIVHYLAALLAELFAEIGFPGGG